MNEPGQITRELSTQAERGELAALETRVLELERVVADYALRYGLTERARRAMVGIPAAR